MRQTRNPVVNYSHSQTLRTLTFSSSGESSSPSDTLETLDLSFPVFSFAGHKVVLANIKLIFASSRTDTAEKL